MSDGLWIVTGASRGIGRAIALALRDQRLLLTATRQAHLEPVLRELPGASGLELELSVPGSVALLERALARERVAGLVNNAGVLDRGNLEALTDAQIEHSLSVNIAGAMKVTRAALARMDQGARIINLGSISGTLGTPGASLYNATKWAMTGLTKSWAEELKPRGIFVAEVRPGSVDTDMLKQTPFPPVMKPEDVARVVRYLAFDAPFAMTGSAVDVFG